MVYLFLGIVMIALSILFRLAAVFRLTIPLVYALLVPTVFHDWYYAHRQLADVIWYMLLAVVVLSWIVSLVRKIRDIRYQRSEDQMLEQIIQKRVQEAKTYGHPEPDGGYRIQVDDLVDGN